MTASPGADLGRVFDPSDELPFAVDAGARPETLFRLGGGGHVMGEVRKEQRIALGQRLFIKQIETGQVGRGLDAGGGEDRGHYVNVGHQPALVLAWFDLAGPMRDERCPHAVFVRMRLAEFVPAIVSEVKHERVVGHTLSLQLVHEFAAGFVEPFDHREVLGLILIFDGGIFCEQPLWWIVRCVWKEGGIPDEEWFFLSLRLVDEIVDRFHGLAADGKGLSPVAAGGAHVVGEANAPRMLHPVLTRVQGQVSGVGELSWQLRLFEKRLDPIGTILSADGIVSGDAVLMRVQAGEHRRQRRTTDRGGDITAGKGQPFGGESVDVGRPRVWMPGEAVIGPCMIIADYQHHIGPLGVRCSGRKCEHRENKNNA